MRIAAVILGFSLLFFSNSALFAQKWKDPKVKEKKKQGKTYADPKLKKSTYDWKSTRLEYMVGAGACGFLGDLGGADQPGQPFVFDYEPTTTRYSFSVGARYFIRENQAIRGTFSYAQVRGDDALTNYPNRRYRNINFKSPIYELAAIYELHLIKPNYIHFAGANTTKVFDGNRFGAYLSGGIGMFRFNPKGKLGTQYYKLHPLRTEGQEFADGPDPYRRFAFTFPIGGGVYMLLNKNFTLGLDVGYRWTTTDYIDDASTYYYDNDAIRARDGKLAAYFANPSVGLDDVPNADWYSANQPRGGAGNDSYLFAQVTLSKSFTPSISNKEFKQKKRRKASPYKKVKEKKVKKKRKFKSPNLKFGKRRKRSKITTF